MPILKKKSDSTPEKLIDPCVNGVSFGRNKRPHKAGAEIKCYRCESFMGCVWCCEARRELICTRCGNWADKAGVHQHGNVMPSEKVKHVNTDRGWKHWEKGSELPANVGEIIKTKVKGVD